MKRHCNHRFQAAIQAGLSEIPCWVTEMDDDTAYMELVKANNQGELLALERGVHFNESDLGVREYAEQLGVSPSAVTQESNAGKVLTRVNSDFEQVKEKYRHLYEISKADSKHWQMLVDLLIKCDWSVKDVQGMELWAA